MKKFLVLLALSFTSISAFAGSEVLVNIDEPISGSYDGIQITRGVTQSGSIVLDVDYKGKLSRGLPIAAYVRVRYLDGDRDGFFPMTYNQDSMGRITWTLTLTNGCSKNDSRIGCDESSDAKMKHLLFWAKGLGRKLNALDIEFAFVDAKDHWDSGSNSQNYHYQFGEMTY